MPSTPEGRSGHHTQRLWEQALMKMRHSRVLAKLRNEGVVCCVKLNLSDARVADIAAQSGVDCLWLDLEHTPNTLEQTEVQVLAARVHDVDTVVRVQRGSYSDIIRPLEMGATGVMVPHVMSAEDARRVAWLTRFHPLGRRPIDGGNADAAYGTVPLKDYMEWSNRERFVIIQIEDPEPLAELDEIAQVRGIDMLFFGPVDFSQGIGTPCNLEHPEVVKTRGLIAEAARRYGKFAGTVGDLKSLPELVELGYQFIGVGADVVALSQYFCERAAAFGAGLTRPPRKDV